MSVTIVNEQRIGRGWFVPADEVAAVMEYVGLNATRVIVDTFTLAGGTTEHGGRIWIKSRMVRAWFDEVLDGRDSILIYRNGRDTFPPAPAPKMKAALPERHEHDPAGGSFERQGQHEIHCRCGAVNLRTSRQLAAPELLCDQCGRQLTPDDHGRPLAPTGKR